MSTSQNGATRSDAFFRGKNIASFIHRAFTKTMGFDDSDLERPVIGICNTHSEMNNCNSHLRDIDR